MPDPVAFTLFGRPIFWYGVCFALGFLAALGNWAWLGRTNRKFRDEAGDFLLWAMVSAVVGARLAYVIANWNTQFANQPLWNILRFDQGGLIYYGGLICGILTTVLYMRLRKLPTWSFGDFIVTALPLGHALGRIGCFVNGCCFGKLCSAEALFKVRYPIASNPGNYFSPQLPILHPVQLYEALGNFIIWALLLWIHQRKRIHGRVVAAYLLIYPLLRFATESLRGDDRLSTGMLTNAQWISLTMLAAGVALWFGSPHAAENRAQPSR